MLEMPIYLKILQVSDVTQRYADWYNDPEITEFSDNQYRNFTLEGQKSYVAACLDDPDIELYGIFDGSSHIGNIVISGFNGFHKRATITYVIGERDYWGRGIGTYAISEIIKIARKKGLHRLYAGLAETNIGSRQVLEKNGFQLEGKLKQHLYYNNQFYDQLDFGLIL